MECMSFWLGQQMFDIKKLLYGGFTIHMSTIFYLAEKD
jgi:hypothetical protein